MLVSLSTLKSRLGILLSDTQYDPLLTSAIQAVSARFDRETRRTLARAENATFQFPAPDTEIIVPCYPIESVFGFDLKYTEADGWIEQTAIDYLIRSSTVISLLSPLAFSLQPFFFLPSPASATLVAIYSLPTRQLPAPPRSPPTSNKPPSNKSPSGSKIAIALAFAHSGPAAALTNNSPLSTSCPPPPTSSASIAAVPNPRTNRAC